MLAKVCSAAVNGIEAYPVEVEVNAGFGDTIIVIVGLPDAAVKESRDRVMTAMQGFGTAASDYDIQVMNTKTGAGVRVTADRPLANLMLWSIRAKKLVVSKLAGTTPVLMSCPG